MIFAKPADNLEDTEYICTDLVGSWDDLSEFLSPEEEALFSHGDANKAVLRDKLILVASCRKKSPSET